MKIIEFGSIFTSLRMQEDNEIKMINLLGIKKCRGNWHPRSWSSITFFICWRENISASINYLLIRDAMEFERKKVHANRKNHSMVSICIPIFSLSINSEWHSPISRNELRICNRVQSWWKTLKVSTIIRSWTSNWTLAAIMVTYCVCQHQINLKTIFVIERANRNTLPLRQRRMD